MVVSVVSSADGFDEVLAAATAGQEWAVACLYDALQPGLLRYLGGREKSVAEDLASETWLAVAQGIGASRETRGPSGPGSSPSPDGASPGGRRWPSPTSNWLTSPIG